MTTEDIIIHLLCLVDDRMKEVPKHSQAKLYPSELVTIGLLFALKGATSAPFIAGAIRDYEALFAGLPDRTRLQRLLVTHQDWNERFLADPSFFLVIDSYPIELLFPVREGCTPEQFGKNPKTRGIGASASSCVGGRVALARWSTGIGIR